MTHVKLATKDSVNAVGVIASAAQSDASSALLDAAAALTAANAALALANQALNVVKPASPGTFLISGGSYAFAGALSYTVAPSVYMINGVQYTSPGGTATSGAANGSNPRFDAIVLDAAGAVSVIAGTASATPSLPDVDALQYLVRTYIRVDAAATAIAVAVTDVYRENVEWTSSVSGGAVNANASVAATARTGSKYVQFTAAAAGDFVRFTAPAPISLAGQRQLVTFLNPAAAFPNAKSISATLYLAGVKIGQSATIKDGAFGFVGSTLSYQQIVIPTGIFNVPSNSQVDRVEFKIVGGGATISFRIDDVFWEGSSTAVPDTVTTALQAAVDNLRIRTITFPIEGGGSVITTGVKDDQYVDFAGKILGWTILGDQSGSIVIDIWRDSYANYPPVLADSIVASAKPTISGAIKAQSSALTGWNTSFNAGDSFRINVDSVTSLLRATLTLKVLVA